MYLAIRPAQGLCNRFRAMVSANAFCRTTGRALFIWWRASRDTCPASFSTLWKKSPGTLINEADFRQCMREAKPYFNKIPANSSQPVYVLKGDNCFCAPGVEITVQDAEDFVPADYITDCVEYITERFFMQEEHVVAICMRRNNRNASRAMLQSSPLQWFVDCIRRILKETNNRTLFFLASDTYGSSHILHGLFGRHILEIPRRGYSIGNPDIAVAGLASLLLMARTSAIYGTYFSSWHYAARHFNPTIPIITPRGELPPYELTIPRQWNGPRSTICRFKPESVDVIC